MDAVPSHPSTLQENEITWRTWLCDHLGAENSGTSLLTQRITTEFFKYILWAYQAVETQCANQKHVAMIIRQTLEGTFNSVITEL